MNKVILTHDRVFMSIVGPSGCGKTELLFRMLKGSIFYARFEKIYYFFKEFQPLFKDMQRVIPGIEFLKYSGFDITRNLSHGTRQFSSTSCSIHQYFDMKIN